ELTASIERTARLLQTETARISIETIRAASGRLDFEVSVKNLTGHKLPTAYPSRRAWLHVTVRDRQNRIVFESGAVRPDGSIAGNVNDRDPGRFEPHRDEIRSAEQVQIYESIMGDAMGAVTTGLLTAVRYLKDNRLLPKGFDKAGASKDIAVIGEAAADANFNGAGDLVKYSAPVGNSEGPFTAEAELLFQPIGYRWANNLKGYDAAEPRQFTAYYDSMSSSSSISLAKA